MSHDKRISQMSIEYLSPWGQARVVHHLQHALALMDEGQESMQIALECFNADATALLAAVTEALQGRKPLADLTVEQRRLLDKQLDETARAPLNGSLHVEDLLAPGVALVVLDGDELFEIKPDGTRTRLN